LGDTGGEAYVGQVLQSPCGSVGVGGQGRCQPRGEAPWLLAARELLTTSWQRECSPELRGVLSLEDEA
jgi:hypothetical protein